MENKFQYKVCKVIKETHDVSTLVLENLSGENLQYIAGQYVTVYFPELGTPEGKAYSISSAAIEDGKTFTLTVKAMGEFSRKLVSLKPGDVIVGSAPYGYFYSESDSAPVIMIAAGIGITPFRSQIFEMLAKNPKRQINLFHSIRTTADHLFKDQLHDLAEKYPDFKIKYFITRENGTDKKTEKNITYSRMTPKDILAGISQNNLSPKDNPEFLICGSISFTRDIWRGLRDVGIPEENLYTEAFFSH